MQKATFLIVSNRDGRPVRQGTGLLRTEQRLHCGERHVPMRLQQRVINRLYNLRLCVLQFIPRQIRILLRRGQGRVGLRRHQRVQHGSGSMRRERPLFQRTGNLPMPLQGRLQWRRV